MAARVHGPKGIKPHRLVRVYSDSTIVEAVNFLKTLAKKIGILFLGRLPNFKDSSIIEIAICRNEAFSVRSV